jgi:hypothetical protein
MARAALRAALAHHTQRLGELGFLTALRGGSRSRSNSSDTDPGAAAAAEASLPALTIVTGRGKGSVGGQPVLRSAVAGMLRELGLLERDDNEQDDAGGDARGPQGNSSSGGGSSSSGSSGGPIAGNSAGSSSSGGTPGGRSKNPGAVVVPGAGLLRRLLAGFHGSQAMSIAAEALAADLRERDAARERERRVQVEMEG